MAFTQNALRAMRDGRRAARFQRRDEPRRGRGRVARRPPAPARRAALGWRRQLHRGDRPDEGHPAAAVRARHAGRGWPGRRGDPDRLGRARDAEHAQRRRPRARQPRYRAARPVARAARRSRPTPSPSRAPWAPSPRRCGSCPAGSCSSAPSASPLFVLFDLVDGAMARAKGKGTPFGAVLDSTCDRIADGALFAALTWWALGVGAGPRARRRRPDLPRRGPADLLHQGAGRGGGPARGRRPGRAGRAADPRPRRHRARRASGVPYALDVALWVLAAASLWTVGQRLAEARRSARDLPPEPAAP